MMIIIFKNSGGIKGERTTWHRPDTSKMKYEQNIGEKGTYTFTTSIASKSKSLQLKHSKKVGGQNPRGPARALD